MGEHSAAASDSNAHANADANADPKSDRLPEPVRVRNADSILQRDAVTDIAAIDSPYIRISDTDAERDK